MARPVDKVTPVPVVFHDVPLVQEDFAADVHAGLSHAPKRLPPKYFYDERGSVLFDTICALPEYYLTRADIEIIDTRADTIAGILGDRIQLVELGSGSSKKIQLLLDALQPEMYMPIDISREHLRVSTNALSRTFPWLRIHAVCADYSAGIELPHHDPRLRIAAFFPGSSIGNFEPADAMRFLQSIATLVGPGGHLVISVDLKKDPRILEAAYNDCQGITAQFNLNVLHRINRELGADIKVENFEHQAVYNQVEGRIEMHLVSRCSQTIGVAGHSYHFESGESIHTENSYKYGIQQFQDLARRAGYRPVEVWTDRQNLFSLHCLQAQITELS